MGEDGITYKYGGPSCKLCGDRGIPLYEGVKVAKSQILAESTWSYYVCGNKDCGSIWLEPEPSEEAIKGFYKEDYYTHRGPNNSVLRKILQSVKKTRAGYLLGYTIYLHNEQKGRLLDVGCGSGIYLKEMQDLGWEVEGIDIDEQALDIARNRYGLRVHHRELTECNFDKESFDIVTLNHVIEHTIFPEELIRECLRVLRPKGKLFIATPNVRSLGHHLFKKAWYHLDAPRHITLFTPNSFKNMSSKYEPFHSTVTTTIRGSRPVFIGSAISKYGYMKDRKMFRYMINVAATVFSVLEFALLKADCNCGEDLTVIIEKK